MNGLDFMSLFEVLIGAYLIYAAVTNKGRIYVNENLIKGKEEEYHRMIRRLCTVGGPLCLLDVLFDYLKLLPLSYLSLAVLFAYVVYVLVRTKKITAPRK